MSPTPTIALPRFAPVQPSAEPTFVRLLWEHQLQSAATAAPPATAPTQAPWPGFFPEPAQPTQATPPTPAPTPARVRPPAVREPAPGPSAPAPGPGELAVRRRDLAVRPAGPALERSEPALRRTARHAAAEDAKLLEALARLLSTVRAGTLFPRAVFIVLGFTAITTLALAIIEALPLPLGASFIVAPAALTMCLVGLRHPEWGRRALIGWVAGIVATFVYDIARLTAVQLGVFGDPIPGIGDLLLDREGVHWLVGYGWRFLGNGGGMAIAFAMLPWRGVRAGTVYGTLICLGLFAVLYFFPVAQTHFFALEPMAAVVGMLGHWIYGAVLGGITVRYLPPVRVSLRDAVSPRTAPAAPRPAPVAAPVSASVPRPAPAAVAPMSPA